MAIRVKAKEGAVTLSSEGWTLDIPVRDGITDDMALLIQALKKKTQESIEMPFKRHQEEIKNFNKALSNDVKALKGLHSVLFKK